MKKSNFLNKLKVEESLKLVEPSEEISKSYLIKSDKCIQVAKLAYDAGIYENAVSEAYYSIYNTVMSLFFKCGGKMRESFWSSPPNKRTFQSGRALPHIFRI